MANDNPVQNPVSAVGAASVAPAPPPKVGLSAPRPSGGGSSAPAPKEDRVEISDAARAAASSGAPARTPPPPPLQGDGNAGDVKFSYDASTNTLQTQVVNPKTGKPILEIPSDAQIQLRKSLQERFSRQSQAVEESSLSSDAGANEES